MARRRVRDKNANMRLCKFHPEREAVHNKNGQSTGMCPECLATFGKKGAKGKWQKQPEPVAVIRDPLADIAGKVAMAVVDMARPGAEQAVFSLVMKEIQGRAASMIQAKTFGEQG